MQDAQPSEPHGWPGLCCLFNLNDFLLPWFINSQKLALIFNHAWPYVISLLEVFPADGLTGRRCDIPGSRARAGPTLVLPTMEVLDGAWHLVPSFAALWGVALSSQRCFVKKKKKLF